MGNDRPTRRGRGRSGRAALALAVAIAMAACASNGGESSASPATGDRTTTAPAGGDTSTSAASHGPKPCSEDRHAVVVDGDGTLTARDSELATWLANPAYDPAIRPGAVELMKAWRSRGYEIIYLTGRPASVKVGSQPIADATAAWLKRHGFPTGKGTQLFVWDTKAIAKQDQYKTQTLMDLSADGIALDYAYTNATIDVISYVTAGVHADHIFTVGAAAGQDGTVAVPGPGLQAHQLTVVEKLPDVCSS
jgi:hypothetical protein